MPGPKNGSAVPVIPPENVPNEVDVAFGSLTEPSVGPHTVSESTCTRMPSYFSTFSKLFGFKSVGVSVIAAGSELPVETIPTVGPVSSVAGGLFGSLLGLNSETVPVTVTRLPTTAATGGALEVKTKIPSDVV